MTSFSKTFVILLAVVFTFACKKESADPKPKSDDANQGDDSSDTDGSGGVEGGASEGGDDDGDSDHDEVPTDYTVSDLLNTAKKATTRFERLAITNSAFKSVKTWKSEYYTWAKLTYTITSSGSSITEEHIFLACHFHGEELGCHKKDQSDPSEPTDTADDDGLPPIDDELPPIDD